MKHIVIDIQCFRTGENGNVKCTPKELAIYDGKDAYYYLFEAPFPFECLTPALQREAVYNIKYHHGIPWTAGDVPPKEFSNIIQLITYKADNIYVKGHQKAELLRTFIRHASKPVVELPDHPKLQSTQPVCCNHTLEKCACALSNVYSLYNFFLTKK